MYLPKLRLLKFDNYDKPYIKHLLRQTDEINTDECEDIEVAVSEFVAIRWDGEWLPGKY